MNPVVYEYIVVVVLAFLSVYAITPFIIKLALATNFVDNPSQRKIHKQSKPLLGGLAVFFGFCGVLLYNILIVPGKELNYHIIGYLAGGGLILLIGLIDDRFGMKPILKLFGQILTALIFLFSNDLVNHLGPWYITLPVYLFWMVSLMNAFNFLDNMDGIISGMAGILALGYYSFAFLAKTTPLTPQVHYISLLSLTFAGAVFGFLPHNFNPAKIFLGDAGSMFIGYFLSSLGILTARLAVIRMNSNVYYLLPVLLLSYAIFDISLVSYTRKRDGRRISQGGKDHSTHRMGTVLKSPKVTSIMVYLINIIIVLAAIIVFASASATLLVIATLFFAVGFLFFGKKLDEIPVIITKNQMK